MTDTMRRRLEKVEGSLALENKATKPTVYIELVNPDGKISGTLVLGPNGKGRTPIGDDQHPT